MSILSQCECNQAIQIIIIIICAHCIIIVIAIIIIIIIISSIIIIVIVIVITLIYLSRLSGLQELISFLPSISSPHQFIHH